MNLESLDGERVDQANKPQGFQSQLNEHYFETKKAPVVHSQTWDFPNQYEYAMACFTFDRYLRQRSSDWDILLDKTRNEYEFAPGKSCSVLTQGVVAMVIDDHIFRLEFAAGHMNGGVLTFSSGSQDVSSLVAELKHELRWKNPLRGKFIHILSSGRLEIRMVHAPAAKFDDVVLDPRVKEDLFDNTVFQLQLRNNNGLIFFGEPGTGKSLAAAAVANATMEAGFTVFFLVGAAPFDEISRIADAYLTPAVGILEDVDTFAEDRLSGRPSYFADFLQFMSGLSNRQEPLVIIATTNHLELLDAAIKNRPVRFNRKYEFRKPSNEEVSLMLSRLFPAHVLPPATHQACYGREFTGAHIQEIHRTATTMAAKSKLSVAEVFENAVEVVASHFVTSWKGMGFTAPNGSNGRNGKH